MSLDLIGVALVSCWQLKIDNQREATMRVKRAVVLASVMWAAQGCTDDPTAISATPAAIVDATGDDTVPPFLFPNVGFLTSSGNCTATLITPSHIIAAAHCVSSGLPSTIDFAATPRSGSGIESIPTARCWMPNAYTRINVGIVRPGLRLSPTESDEAMLARLGDSCGVLTGLGVDDAGHGEPAVDLALIELARPVPHPVGTGIDLGSIGGGGLSVVPSAIAPPTSFFPATAVGYGSTCDPTTVGGCGGPAAGTRRYRSGLHAGGGDWILLSGTEVLGRGDSGGPLFDVTGPQPVLVGVASSAGGPFAQNWVGMSARSQAWIATHVDLARPQNACGTYADLRADPTNDADGDYVLDADEAPEARGIFNPCQLNALTADADHDGVADDIDACPSSASISSLRGALPDTDHDGAPDVCDCNATSDLSDADFDYVADACDNCRRVPNTSQANCNNDTFGDACDPNDLDRDGVTNACDSCPNDPNPSQANCNEDAERIALHCGAAGLCPGILGDACDPNPCPYTRPDVQLETLQFAGAPAAVRYLVPEQIRVGGVVAGPAVRALTDFRFCACDLAAAGGDGSVDTNDVATRLACAAQSPAPSCTLATGAVAGSHASDLFDRPEVSSPPPSWRHMTFDPLYFPIGVPTDPQYHDSRPLAPAIPVGSDRTQRWRLWQAPAPAEPDVVRWRPIYPIGPVIDPNAPAFPGVLWGHTPRNAGATSDAPARELRSHYESGGFAPQFLVAFPPSDVLRHYYPIPDCVGGRQLPCLGSASWFHPAASSIFTHSAAFSAGTPFPSLPSLAASDLVWTHVAEPIELLRREQTLRFIGTSLDGERVADVLHLTANGYAPAAWRPTCQGPNCGPPNCNLTHLCFGASSAATRVSASAAPTSGRLLVLSASRGELFVLDTAIRVIDLEGGTRRVLDGSRVALGELHAATYDALRDRLFVIDEISGPGSRHRRRVARLLSIDPVDGSTTVVGSWARLGFATRFALGPAPDGALYLAASSESGGHVLVSLSVEHHPAVWHHPAWDELVTRGIGAGGGVLGSHTTYASRFAVTFVVERDGHAEVASYAPTMARFHAGECMGDVF